MSSVIFEHVVKRYSGAARASVNDCSLTVEEGQFVVLLGPSGCGKTTLLKMVNRIIEPTSGHILVGDTEVHSLPATALRRRIGYVIQQVGLFPHMSVEDNIATVPRLMHWERGRTSNRIDELLDLVGLPPAEYRKRRPRQLSGGQQQRVGIARALAADPALLLMDEPFGAIDAITRTHLQTQMLEIQRRLGKTIIFVTHDIEEALRLATLLVVMRDGQIVQADAPRQILTHPADAFVAELVGAADPLRRLSMIPVSEIMQPLTSHNGHDGQRTVGQGSDARSALVLLLAHAHAPLTVVDEGGQAVGIVTREAIEAVSASADSPQRVGVAP